MKFGNGAYPLAVISKYAYSPLRTDGITVVSTEVEFLGVLMAADDFLDT